MKVVINTQYKENYGTVSEPYWKFKGGSTYIIAASDRAEADQIIFMFVWMTSSLLSAAYLLPIVYRAFFLAPTKGDDHSSGDATDDGEGIKEAPVFCLIGLGTAAVLTVVAFFMADDLSKMLAPLAGKLG